MSDSFYKFVQNIAGQKTSDEMIGDDEYEESQPDFEGGYDSIIKEARELLL